jgi:hypothetical protein
VGQRDSTTEDLRCNRRLEMAVAQKNAGGGGTPRQDSTARTGGLTRMATARTGGLTRMAAAGLRYGKKEKLTRLIMPGPPVHSG